MDKNGNGLIEKSEFEAAGWEGLESFHELGAEGHHYDVESGRLKPARQMNLADHV